ncbi:MAG: TRAP transporter small permease subunit [Pseudoprimorskyibacter sp.]|nr:TRAP transporter small permease subunit [Pseudoprimorskyibacter sp.]
MGGVVSALNVVATCLGVVNAAILRLGNAVGVFCVGAMVVAILIQVFFRYVLNNALPWPDEAARFCMLWMTGAMAPVAFRRGGFVAIDMIPRMLPNLVAQVLALVLLGVSCVVLWTGVELGWNHITGFAGSGKSASLYTFFKIELRGGFGIDWGIQKMPKAQMMGSLFVGVCLLLSVNVELILRSLIRLLGGSSMLLEIDGEEMAGAE